MRDIHRLCGAPSGARYTSDPIRRIALGWEKRSRSVAEKEQDAAMLTLMRLGWGQENPAFRQLFTSQFIPGGTKEQADWFNELQRIQPRLTTPSATLSLPAIPM